MNIQQKIDLENIKFNSVAPLYMNTEKPNPRKKIPLMQYWMLPRDKKQAVKQAIEKEKNYEDWQKIKSYHAGLIRKLELKKATYEVYFGKKRPKDEPIGQAAKNEPIFHFDHTAGYSWFKHPVKSFKKWWWRTFEKESVILINMQLNNGKHISFIRPIDQDRFGIFDGTYLIDLKLAYYSLSAGMYCLDYHQSFDIPVRRNWDIDGLKTAIETTGIIDCPAATNPSNITRFLNSNIIEQIFQGAALGKMLMIMMILIIVIGATVVICTFILNGKIADLAKLVTPLVKK